MRHASPCVWRPSRPDASPWPAPRERSRPCAFAVVSRRGTRQRLRQIRILPVPRRIARSTTSTVRPTAPNTTARAAAYTPVPNVTSASPPCAPTDHPSSASSLCDLARPPVPGAVGQLGPAAALVGLVGGLGRGCNDLGGARVVRATRLPPLSRADGAQQEDGHSGRQAAWTEIQ